MPVRFFKKTQLIVRCPGMWPSSLIHREAGQHGQVANDVISDKSCSFLRKKSYGVFNSMVKGSRFEYDSRPPLTLQNTRGATSGQSDFFSGQQTFDGDNTIIKDRYLLKRTTKLNATIVLLHTVIIKSHSS